MKINAVIESSNGGTLVLDFPCNIYDVYEKLVEPHIRPKILFDRFNLIEQDEDEENKIEQIDII